MAPGPARELAWLEYSGQQQVPIQGSCTIGRSPSNTVALSSDMVSRRHAAVQVQRENEYWLIDFGSHNGTYLNGAKIVQATRLQHGDRIRIGSFEFEFNLPFGQRPPPGKTLIKDTVTDLRNVRCWLLVADIIGSTQLVKDLPPEEMPKISGRWLAECRKTIEGQGGRINQFLGDGFFAYWRDTKNVPVIVQRALAELRGLQEQGSPPFRMVGHYGEVVLGGVAVGEEERITGKEVHFTFRLEKLAGHLGAPRLLSHAAWDRLGRPDSTREHGRYSLPGFDSEFAVYVF